ncbi:MAG: formate dehydrogenase subunit gamma [Methyloversatilis sp.]|jgi:formate dehydrogenase subunit gamma|nr:formate dehydrogenase subunit gamma [Methyloversatilis sp.]MBP6194705.1 formate dehydrogenase subunit gamma [Methyloversatilis sp.]MBP9116705.1 formate dehydrogenase subunit gamma [Methyloversatilis sp.]
MKLHFSWLVRLLCCVAALCALPAMPAMAADAAAASEQALRAQSQPLNNAPVWREVRSGDAHHTTVKGIDAGVLIQSGGQTWRALRNGPVMLYGGIALCAMLLLLAAFFKLRGPIKLSGSKTGKLIQRFNTVERAAHWSMAISFCVLAVSGIVMLFGKHVLLPVFGYSLFSTVAAVCKNVHNFVGPLFILSVLVFIVLFIRDNVWQAIDALWIRKAGGLLSGEHVPSHRFNFGEKTWFWLGVVGLSTLVGVSGLVLNFPNFEQGRSVMQIANVVHLVGSLLVMTLSLAHIYIGSIGMEGALDSMKTGYVDETWAREHHELWYDEAVRRQPEEPRSGALSGVARI